MKRKLLSTVLTIGVLLSAVGCGQTESPDMSASEVEDSKSEDSK